MNAQDLSEFLESLERPLSTGEQIAAATVIRNHRLELERFIKQKNAEERFDLAAHYKQLIQRHEAPPRGPIFDEDRCSLYRPYYSPRPRNSLTLPTARPGLRTVGYLLFAGIVLGVAAIFYTAARYLTDISDLREQQMQEFQPHIFKKHARGLHEEKGPRKESQVQKEKEE